jgi:hypothetical protein
MLLKGHLNEMKVEVADFTASIKEDGNALGNVTIAAVTADLAHKELYNTYDKLGVSQDTVTKAAMGNAAAMNEVTAATAKALKAGNSVESLTAAAQNLAQMHATADGLHKQLAAQQQATAAADDATAATKAQADSQAFLVQTGKNLAGVEMQHTAAVRAATEAQAAATDTKSADVQVTKASSSATGSNTTVKNADTAATHAQTAATKSSTLAARDAGKAVNDHAKANDTSAKAATSAAAAQKLTSDASATDAAKKKAQAAATRDAAAATRAATTAANEDTRASDASATAADKASRASDAASKAADAKSKALAAASKASADEAAAQRAAAEAAAEAAFEHQIGVTALKGWAAAAADTTHSSDVLADSVTAEVGAMKDAKDKANGLRDALDALNGVHIQAGKAAIDVQNKIADLTKTLHENGTTLDITTEKGRTNMGAVYDLATAVNTHAQAVVDETGSVAAGNAAMASSRDEFDKVLAHAGLTTKQIQDFNNTLLQTPKLVPVAVALDTSAALGKLKEFHNQAGQLLYIQVGTGMKQAFATGGLISGAGSETSDSIPIMASRNEFILNAAATRAIGVGNLTRWNSAYGGAGTIVKPQMVASSASPAGQSSVPGSSPLHIEHYYESASGGAQQTAVDLAWLLHARGVAA